MQKARTLGLAAVAFWLAAAAPAAAQIQTVQMEGVLTSSGGGAAADGNYSLNVQLLDAQGGKAVWSETGLTTAVKGGQFALALGAKTPLTAATVAGDRWVQLQVGSDPPLPSVPARSVLYALRAQAADELACSGCLKATHLDPAFLQGLAKGSDLQAYAKSTDLSGYAKSSDLAAYAKVADLSSYAKTADLADYVKASSLAKVAGTGSYADLSSKPVLAQLGMSCGTGLVMKGIKADGSYDCISAALDAANLPKDGLDEISNGLLTNQFNEVSASTKPPIDILDAFPAGVTDEITVADFGVAQGITLSVDVINSNIAKIKVTIYDPQGTAYVLHDQSGSGTALKSSWPSPTKLVSGDLSTWIGGNPKGKWSIAVADLSGTVGGKDGKLNGWSVQVQTMASKKVAAKGAFQFANATTAPIPCDNSTFGATYANPADKALYVCNGKDWSPIFLTPYGSQENPASSCKDLLLKLPSTKDGQFWVKGSGAAFQVTCDMTTDGGGWTIFANEVTADPTGWSNTAITNASVGGTATPVHGMFGVGGGSTKTFNFQGIGHDKLRVRARYYAVDSWDGESQGARLYIDDSLRWAKSKVWNAVGDGPGWVSATFAPAPWGNNNGPNGYWQVEAGLGIIDHVGAAAKLQFATGIDQDVPDESFAFSHVYVSVR